MAWPTASRPLEARPVIERRLTAFDEAIKTLRPAGGLGNRRRNAVLSRVAPEGGAHGTRSEVMPTDHDPLISDDHLRAFRGRRGLCCGCVQSGRPSSCEPPVFYAGGG